MIIEMNSDVRRAIAALKEIYWNTPAPGKSKALCNHVNK
jgi:hypothetical protein